MQVEGIYTAEPRFEAKAKALKLKQEMAAAAEEEQKTQTSKVFAKPEIYDRTVTPSSIAGLGEAASVARFRGAMANLAYNQNKLHRLADEPLTTTGGAALPPTMGNLDRWLDQPRQRER